MSGVKGEISSMQYVVTFPAGEYRGHSFEDLAKQVLFALVAGKSVSCPEDIKVESLPVVTETMSWWADQIHGWALKAFAPGVTVQSCIAHLRREIDELEADASPQWGEIADILILALHIARLEGVSPDWAVAAKMEVNAKRQWTRLEDGSYQHVEETNGESQVGSDVTHGDSRVHGQPGTKPGSRKDGARGDDPGRPRRQNRGGARDGDGTPGRVAE